jgi:hypothetical protein
MTAELCPVCKGRGQVPAGFYQGFGSLKQRCISPGLLPDVCRGCGGTGVVFDYRPRPLGDPPPPSPYGQINSCLRPVNSEYTISYPPARALFTSISSE